MMGGTIGFESEAPDGSFFYIDVPVTDENLLPIQDDESFGSTQIVPVKHNKKKILYVEDVFVNVELVKQILTRNRPNVELISASNGLAGIEMAQAQTPDLILMDIHMPGMDGQTAFKKLQTISATKSIPVIALTADAMDGDIKKALDIGFKSYLTKPIDIAKFLEEIDRVLA